LLWEALGRILATDVFSRVDSPGFDNSAMDGFAVRAEDCIQPARLAVIGTALAGHSFDRALVQGQAVRIMTGAPLPRGADAVVMSEDTVETVRRSPDARRRQRHRRCAGADTCSVANACCAEAVVSGRRISAWRQASARLHSI
jgi:molybdopterin biosynthesis enzyme